MWLGGQSDKTDTDGPAALVARLILTKSASLPVLVQVANGAGLPTRAWLTDMNQVLGSSCGNALEVGEAAQAGEVTDITRF